jgi:hypothetical protein
MAEVLPQNEPSFLFIVILTREKKKKHNWIATWTIPKSSPLWKSKVVFGNSELGDFELLETSLWW